ncbi:aldo-keto reductase family 1 member B1 [Anabrus simplex]|uniref:aldo-keto reductase family 1 member B1 n=1 Tax=Anabrus simplex TaxID=316456 RepID=UPI0035A30A1D
MGKVSGSIRCFLEQYVTSVSWLEFQESREDLIKGVKDAIDIGYRHIDCATVNKNEADIGKAIADKIEEGAVERNDLYITSKLWNTHHRGDMVIPSLEKSLEDLCLDYLDLYLIQWPMAYKEGSNTCPMKNGQTLYSEVEYTETWKAMEKAVKQGLVKSIGLSNFNSEQVLRVLAVSEIKPVTNQVECHPYLNQKKMKELCDSFNITLTAFSSLGSGDRPWAKSDEPRLLEDTTLAKIAGKYKKSPAQILLRYQIQQGNIVLVRSVIKPLSKENFEIFDFNIHSSDMAKLDGMDRNYRYIHCNCCKSTAIICSKSGQILYFRIQQQQQQQQQQLCVGEQQNVVQGGTRMNTVLIPGDELIRGKNSREVQEQM